MVFVPYRGLIFLNSKKDFVGELQEVFPSPTGDLYFSMAFGILYFENGIRVSVPYRGLIFLNCSGFNFARGFESVSVPYRGLIFLNGHPTKSHIFNSCVSVPYRGLIFLNCLSLSVWIDNGSSFRPLPGTYISQYKNTGDVFASQSFPSPTGDLYFSIFYRFMSVGNHSSFRPLPGTYISQ